MTSCDRLHVMARLRRCVCETDPKRTHRRNELVFLTKSESDTKNPEKQGEVKLN